MTAISRKKNRKKTYVLIVSEKFPAHHFRKGESTNFIHKILHEVKLHTIRNNYEGWKLKIDEVNSGKAIISLRIWNGRPYVDKQIEILQITKLGIQKLQFQDGWAVVDDHTLVPIYKIADNDGLNKEELHAWFKGFPTHELALIQFTKFRYASS